MKASTSGAARRGKENANTNGHASDSEGFEVAPRGGRAGSLDRRGYESIKSEHGEKGGGRRRKDAAERKGPGWFSLVFRVLLGTVALWAFLFTDVSSMAYKSATGIAGRVSFAIPVSSDSRWVCNSRALHSDIRTHSHVHHQAAGPPHGSPEHELPPLQTEVFLTVPRLLVFFAHDHAPITER